MSEQAGQVLLCSWLGFCQRKLPLCSLSRTHPQLWLGSAHPTILILHNPVTRRFCAHTCLLSFEVLASLDQLLDMFQFSPEPFTVKDSSFQRPFHWGHVALVRSICEHLSSCPATAPRRMCTGYRAEQNHLTPHRRDLLVLSDNHQPEYTPVGRRLSIG